MPSAASARTNAEPMKPRPPVTSTRPLTRPPRGCGRRPPPRSRARRTGRARRGRARGSARRRRRRSPAERGRAPARARNVVGGQRLHRPLADTAVVLARVDPAAARVLVDAPARHGRGGRVLVVHQAGAGEERDLPAAVAQPPAQVDVLEVHVEALVETAQPPRSASRRTIMAAPWIQSTRRMRSPSDITQPARCRVSVVTATRAGVGKWKADGCTRPSAWRSRGPAAATARVLVEEPPQPLDATRVENGVVVQDEHVPAARAAAGEVVVGAEPAPQPAGDHRDAGVRGGDGGGDADGVIDDDRLDGRGSGRRRDRIETGLRAARGRRSRRSRRSRRGRRPRREDTRCGMGTVPAGGGGLSPVVVIRAGIRAWTMPLLQDRRR